MPIDATAVLISADSSLVESCRRVIDAVSSLPVIVLATAEEAKVALRQQDVVLVLIHIAKKSEAIAVVRLLREVTSLERSVAIVAISEQHDVEQAWSLVRLDRSAKRRDQAFSS
jgi:hypothetical protein